MVQYSRYFIGPFLMRRYIVLIIIGFILGVLTYAFINFGMGYHTEQLVLSGLLGVLISYTVNGTNPYLNRWLGWKKYTGIRLLSGILLNTIIALIYVWCGMIAHHYFKNNSLPNEVLGLETSIELVILLFALALIYNIVYFAFYSYNQYHHTQIAELKAEREQTQLQLAALKSQLSPHFLFNGINSLTLLMHDDTQKAEQFIRSMAKCYQYILENHRSSLITLKDELDFLNAYTLLLQTRYGGAFRLVQQLTQFHLNTKIPPLTLQILVENALKHNKVAMASPITISITGNKKTLTVTNNIIPKKRESHRSTGIGLKNIRGRYQILSQKPIKVSDSPQFSVSLPLLTHE